MTRSRTAGAAAGVVAALAYAVEQEIDLRLFNHNTDDLTLLGRLVTSNDRRIRPLGLAMHLANGAALGAVYGALVHDRLPGSPATRGLAFALAETVTLYPLAFLEDYHPGVREGRLDRYTNLTAITQQLLRHVAFGAVLGPLASRLRRG